jgi:NTP pyrophosphatase (non-canonical NTP hydrolase)
MERADLVWLHCPEGYVGASGAMELGHAHALGIRVFATESPEDVTLRDLVTVSESPAAALSALDAEPGDAPSDGLVGLQSYYARVAELRGWSDETATLTLEHLRGEVDELEDALSQRAETEMALELADVQLYLVHLANILEIDLGAAVQAKEKINESRFRLSRERMAA